MYFQYQIEPNFDDSGLMVFERVFKKVLPQFINIWTSIRGNAAHKEVKQGRRKLLNQEMENQYGIRDIDNRYRKTIHTKLLIKLHLDFSNFAL